MKPQNPRATIKTRIIELRTQIALCKTDGDPRHVHELNNQIQWLFYSKLSGSVQEYVELAKLVLEGEDLRLTRFEDSHLQWQTGQGIIELLGQTNVVEEVAKDPKYHRIMAYVCHHGTNKRICNLANRSPAKGRQVTARWMGAPLTDETKKSPAGMCAVFYGIGAWALYSEDRTNDGAFALYLYRLGLPVVINEHARKASLQHSTVDVLDSIPTDFAL